MRVSAKNSAYGVFVVATTAVVANLMILQPQRTDGSFNPRGAQSGRITETAALAVPQIDEGTSVARSDAAAAITQRMVVAPPALDPKDTVRAVQLALTARGYETGGIDGVPGPVTRAAILAFEADHGLPLTAEPTDELAQLILSGATRGAHASSAALMPNPRAEELIRNVQGMLQRLGFAIKKVDGRLGEATIEAIRAFEKQHGMPDSGRISGELVARLTRLSRSS
jgi:peptidoglycan hydrolase-like protein with peptidoglycan-binding domain